MSKQYPFEGRIAVVEETTAVNIKHIIVRSLVVMLPVMVVVILSDQLTKWVILSSFYVGKIVPVIDGFFNLTLTYNKGAAFGLFGSIKNDDLRHAILFGAALGAFILVAVLIYHEYAKDRIAHVAFAMIIGGAIGNIIDRIRFGAVVDFLDVYIKSYHWPAFNVADASICIGVIILLFRPKPKHDH